MRPGRLTRPVLGTRRSLALLRHGHEVQRSIQATGQLREIDIEAELVANQVEHLIVVCVLHEVGSRTDVGRVLSLRDKLEVELISGGGDTIGTAVVRPFDGTVGCASTVGRAERLIPGVSVEAVGVAVRSLVVEPVDL